MEWQILAWGRLADAAAGGLIVLTVGSLAAWFCRQPVRRARLVVLSLLGGVAVPCLGALPVAPQWSARLLPAAHAPLRSRPDNDAPSGAMSRLRLPDPARSRDPLELTERLGEKPTGAAWFDHAPAPSRPVNPSPGWWWTVPPAETVLLRCYFAVAAGLAAWWFVGQVVLWRVTRTARPVPGAVRDDFLRLTGAGGERVVLLASDRIALPFTYAWVRPVILLPSTLCDGGEPGAASVRPGARVVARREARRLDRGTSRAWRDSSSFISPCSGG